MLGFNLRRASVRASAGALLALGFGSGLMAQAPAPPPDATQRPITVTGEALTPPVARHRATQFLRATGVAAGETPAARWTEPVCPRVLGLTAEGARAAEATIRAIAAEVGAAVAAEPCDSNIVVSFTADAAALVREIERREPRRLSDLDPSERRTLLNGSAPIRWWHTSEERGRHGGNGREGRTSAAMTGASTEIRGGGFGGTLANDVPTMMHYQDSLISTLTVRALLSATVIVDQDAVMGRRLHTIAAYAALVALAEIRPTELNPEGSILSLFSAPTPPTRLTAQDIGFLQTLYRLPLDRQARHHRGHLVGGMVSATTAAGN